MVTILHEYLNFFTDFIIFDPSFTIKIIQCYEAFIVIADKRSKISNDNK